MSSKKMTRPPVRSVLKDGILHIPLGPQYAGYVLALSGVDVKNDEFIIRLKILMDPNKANTGT